MKRVGIVFMILLLLLTGCSREPVIDPTEFDEHPFDLSLLAYIGNPSGQIEKYLEQEAIDWDGRYNSLDILLGADLKEPFILDGDAYQLSLIWYPHPGAFYGMYYGRTLEQVPVEELRDEVLTLYGLLETALGAEQERNDISLKERFSDEQLKMEAETAYNAYWLMEDDLRFLTFSDPMALVCRMNVISYHGDIQIGVSYELYPSNTGPYWGWPL